MADDFDLEVTWHAERYQRWILDSFRLDFAGREVLEVGAGAGAITRWIAERAAHVAALEPDPRLAQAITSLRLPNVVPLVSSVGSLAREPRFDVAIAVNVLEHIDDDGHAVSLIRDALRPGGALAILVPAHQALFGSLDRRYGHRRRYSRRRLDRLLTERDLEVDLIRYFNPLGAAGWLLLGRVLRRRTLPPASVAFAESVLVPLGTALDRLGRPPLGQSLIAVAHKAGRGQPRAA